MKKKIKYFLNGFGIFLNLLIRDKTTRYTGRCSRYDRVYQLDNRIHSKQ